MKTKQLTKSEVQLDLNWTNHIDYIFNSVLVDPEEYDIYSNEEWTKINEKEFMRYSYDDFKESITTSRSLKRCFIELDLEEVIFKQNNGSVFNVQWNFLGKLKYSTTKKHKFVKLKISAYNDWMENNKKEKFFCLSLLNLETVFY